MLHQYVITDHPNTEYWMKELSKLRAAGVPTAKPDKKLGILYKAWCDTFYSSKSPTLKVIVRTRFYKAMWEHGYRPATAYDFGPVWKHMGR